LARQGIVPQFSSAKVLDLDDEEENQARPHNTSMSLVAKVPFTPSGLDSSDVDCSTTPMSQSHARKYLDSLGAIQTIKRVRTLVDA
jgi:hypothetical protein